MPWALAIPTSASAQALTWDGVGAGVTKGLDGIDDEDGRPGRRGDVDHVGELSARDERQALALERQPLGSPRDLGPRLLPRGDEAGAPGAGEARRQLEEKGRLARAGRPREEHHRAGDESAAEDAIDRGEPGPDPGLLELGGQVEDGRLAPRADRPQRAPRRKATC